MTVGLLIITHGQVGKALVEAATSVLGMCPLQTYILSVPQDCKPEAQAEKARQSIDQLDDGAGVLVLTDMYGATPSNIASTLQGERIAVVSGLNLPMLVRVLNYPGLSLEELVEKACSGGRDGVLLCSPR